MFEGGRRVDELKTNFVKNKPVISIVTVVRNCENTIEDTIINVINQKYPNIEYIVIDGQSTDGTLNKIRKYEESIDYWISEPDSGIYDAMNKGIDLATGDWVSFMNAGDYFFSNSTIKSIVSEIRKQNFDIIYGDFIVAHQNFNHKSLIKAKTTEKILYGNLYSHQSCFIKAKVIKQNKFNLKYKITADYFQMVSLFYQNNKFFYLPIPISVMLAGGVSYSNINTYKEQIKIVHSFKPFSISIFYFFSLIILSFIRSILGVKIVTLIRKIKWKYLV